MDARAHPAPRTRLADGVPDTTSAAVPAPHWIEGSSSQSQATNCFTGFLEPGVGAHTGFFADPVAGIPQAGAHFTWIHVVVAGPGNPCSGTGVWPDIQLPPGVAWHRQAKIVCFRNGIQVTDAAACPQWSELRVGAGLAARGGELVVLLHAFAGQDTQMATLRARTALFARSTCQGLPVTVNLRFGERPTGGNDVILGTGAGDRIAAGAGNDVVCAGASNDVVSGGAGRDQIVGGAGNDTLNGDAGADFPDGSAGRDICRGAAGTDRSRGSETRVGIP